MGEVYRARDSKLQRDVAIKVLPAVFTADPERLARFEREARVLASLNHPNIAHIHGFEQDGEVRALVLELVEGQTLEDRLRSVSSISTRTPALSTAEALGIARQIADALDTAHEKGIVHRDLKPANVKITPEGVVKVLDFGLAKTRGNVPAAATAEAPTMSAPATTDGVLLGTVPYMSPEQARGQAVDKRTDIWALGCVLYEMLAGKRAFRGATTTDVLAAILEREPDWSALPPSVPRSIERLLRRCLDKDPRRRIRDIGDVHREIEEILAEPAHPVATAPVAVRRRRWASVAAAAALAVLAATAGFMFGRRSTPVVAAAPVRLSISFIERPALTPFGSRHLAISEDGSRVAYAAESQLWIRRMDQLDPVAIGLNGSNPFFSPDGEWVGLFDGTSDLVKVPTDGGPPTSIAENTARHAGAAWRADGTIVFATGEGLFQVPADGGEPRLLARPDRSRGERLYAWPHFLPDGQSVLLTIVYEDSAAPAQIVSLDLKTLESSLLVEGGSDARYVPTGHLVYVSGPTLKTVAFDPDAGTVQGDPVSVPGIMVATAVDNGAANFSISASGTLIYKPPLVDFRSFQSTLQWIDRSGVEERLPIRPSYYSFPRVSPNGKRVALGVTTNRNRGIWILDLERLSLTQLSDGPAEDIMPEWSRDGSRVFFASDRTGDFDVYSQSADGAMEARAELTAPGFQVPLSLTPDGKQLVVFENYKDVGLVTLGQSDRVEPLLHSKAEEWASRVSPDGRWIAYESNESGTQFEILVRPFPDTSGGREKISVDGGRYPVWARNGRELYYVTLDGDMMAAAISLSPSLELGPVTKLFRWRQPGPGVSPIPYDVSPLDGAFIATAPVDAEQSGPTGPTQISVVLNWFSELLRKEGTR